MNHRRKSFLIGSRTHTNVLKGKKVRQQDDGVDNFADYWTDSNEEDTSSTDDDYSELPKVSEIKQKPSTQNVRAIRSSNILHSEAKDNNKPAKIPKSTKPFKNKVSDDDESIHSSQTKKQAMSSKLQEDEHQNSTIRVNILHSEAEDKNKQNNTKILTSSVKSSKNYNTNSLWDSVTKKASPLLPKIKGKEKIFSTKENLVLRNLNETISLPSESGCHNISTSSLSLILKQSKGRKKIFVINENASQALVDSSPIHLLSPIIKLKDINLTNETQSESLADESPNKKNNRKVSTIFKSGSRNHTMLKYRNSSQITKYDDYDAEIMERMHVNEMSLERLTEEQSSILSSPKPSEKNKAVLNNSAIRNSESNAEYDETTAVVQKKKDGIIKNHGDSECVSSNKILSRSQQKNNVSRNNKELFDESSVSQNFHNEKEKTHKKVKASEAFSDKYIENSNVPEKERNSMQNLHIQRKIPVNKSYEKLKTSRNLSKDNEIINAELNQTSTSNIHSEKKNNKAKNKQKQKAPETIEENQNNDNFLEDEAETASIPKQRKRHANESDQDLSLKENDQQLSSSKKKKKNEMHSTDENAPLRQSLRQKFPPLEAWHNERLLYRVEGGIPGGVGVDPDPNSLNQEMQNDQSNFALSRPKDRFGGRQPAKLKSLAFHTIHGKNVTLKKNRSVVSRRAGLHALAYAFTQRPVEINRPVLLLVQETDHYCEGHFVYGITSCNPEDIDPHELPINVDDLYDRSEYWIVKEKSYSFKIGDVISFLINSQGQVEVAVNGEQDPVFYVDHSQPLWLFVNLTHSISELRIASEDVDADVELLEQFSDMKVSGPGPSGQQSPNECVICCEEAVNCALYRCGHMCMCYDCAYKLWKSSSPHCPICRDCILDVIKIYK